MKNLKLSCLLLSCAASLLSLMVASSSAVAQQPSTAAASAPSANAAPRVVNYSGTLNSASGKAVTRVTGATFQLYKDSQGGAPLWTETQKVTPDKNGHYSVQLGSTRSEGLPAEIFVSGATRWLAVQVADEAEQPRVLMVAVPYASTADAGRSAPSTLVLPVPESGGATGGAVNAIPLLAAGANIQSSAYGFGGYRASVATVAATPQTAGLSGISDAQGGVGVWGQDNLGTGVYGTGAVGFATDSNAQQSRTAGGWAKALVWFAPQYSGNIVYCYNSTLMGRAATTPPCGFTWDKTGPGDYIIDLGFEVDDRFFSIAGANMSYNVAVCSHAYSFVQCTHTSFTSTQVEVTSYDQAAHHFADSNTVLYLIVY